MKKILIIQSRARPEMLHAEQGEYTRAIGSAAHTDFISSLNESLEWNTPPHMLAGYDAVMLGGSGEFDFDGGRSVDDSARITSSHIVARIRPLILYILEKDIPLLGICYGHQIISEVLGVPVLHDASQKKVGTFPVALTDAGKSDAIFSDLPEIFMAQYGHKDSVSALPPGAVVLAESAQCRFSALRYGNHVYTTQFHPELTQKDIAWKLQNSPGYLPQGVSVESIAKPSIEASSIIPKFIERIVKE
ncbi:type 1 glutamine amidotransferase [Patescibacteria group bacterium]|nr:type 1 glutamine amidotransferase [Patescibacteria group bacterium]